MSERMHLIRKFEKVIATQNTSALLYSNLTYQKNFLYPQLAMKLSRIFQHPSALTEKLKNSMYKYF